MDCRSDEKTSIPLVQVMH